MKPIIEKIIEETYSSDSDTQEVAILTLIDILRVEGMDEYDRVTYSSYIPWEAIFVSLEKQDKEDIACSMTDLFLMLDEPSIHILWLFEYIGKIGLPYLLTIIREGHYKFDNSQTSQALSSLFSCLDLYDLLKAKQKIIFDDNVKSILAKNDITTFLVEKSLLYLNDHNLNEIQTEIVESIVENTNFLLNIFQNNDLLNTR